MFKRLQALADQLGLAFGVKITKHLPGRRNQKQASKRRDVHMSEELYSTVYFSGCKLSRRGDGSSVLHIPAGADFL